MKTRLGSWLRVRGQAIWSVSYMFSRGTRPCGIIEIEDSVGGAITRDGEAITLRFWCRDEEISFLGVGRGRAGRASRDLSTSLRHLGFVQSGRALRRAAHRPFVQPLPSLYSRI